MFPVELSSFTGLCYKLAKTDVFDMFLKNAVWVYGMMSFFKLK